MMTQNWKTVSKPSETYDPVRFIGGPFDGHWETFQIPPEHLPVDLICLICNRQPTKSNSSNDPLNPELTSIAVYELLYQQQSLQYHFVGLLKPILFNRDSFAPCTTLRKIPG